MTVAEVEAAVARIREIAWDYEAAHSAEDALRHRVLAAIASGAADPAALASVALVTSEIDFMRYTA